MERFNTENPIDKIDFLIKRLVDFSNENKFNFVIYKTFADESAKTFNRYFIQIENVIEKKKIISDLKTNSHFSINNIVTDLLSTNSDNGSKSDGTIYIAPIIPDNRIKGYESNYKQLIELFLNSVDFGTTPQNIHISEIPKYKEALICGKLDLYSKRKNEDGTENEYYFETMINKFVNQNIESLEQFPNITNNKEIIIKYINDLGILSKRILKTFLLLEFCDDCSIIPLPENYKQQNAVKKNRFNTSKSQLIYLLKVVQSYENNISILILKNDLQTASFTQKLFLKLFNNFIEFINDIFTIDISRSPLKEIFEKTFDILKNSINEKEFEIIDNLETKRPTQQINNSKTLIDFFKNGTPIEIIKNLQNKYSDLTNGKQTAYLIYILHKEFNIINYSARDRTKSRKHFINLFLNTELKSIENINKHFNPNDITLKDPKYFNVNEYTTIKEEIQTILNPVT